VKYSETHCSIEETTYFSYQDINMNAVTDISHYCAVWQMKHK